MGAGFHYQVASSNLKLLWLYNVRVGYVESSKHKITFELEVPVCSL